ncbi:hypothetical protein FHL15_007963 [Xylaria flabelliformis]|uniref:Uncharacterized protein n=1 Tax=Xylaria flabelliformis TaxID=2512241 RepID=A0A553HTA3_9PEZI|nr:hypothetical protein FHL15_007963 [Xylaria flabelliformis]
MCKDPARGEYLRADHLVENMLASRLTPGVNNPSKNSPKLACSPRERSVSATNRARPGISQGLSEEEAALVIDSKKARSKGSSFIVVMGAVADSGW